MPAQEPAPSSISSVIDPALRRPFSLFVAICATVLFVIMGLRQAEGFVDGRVELKMSASREKADEQAARLAKMEEQFSTMKDTLGEIRADVRVLRASVEGRRSSVPPQPALSRE